MKKISGIIFAFLLCLLTGVMTAAAAEIPLLTIGTTAAIETAAVGEYNYEMLSSGTTHIPLISQDTKGNFHPQVADWETYDGVTWTLSLIHI